MKTEYVLGFLFLHRRAVVLIRKERPEWQRGKLNGIGGKIEAGESPQQAMTREFTEEAGLTILDWRKFCVMSFPEAVVHCFMADRPTSTGLRCGFDSITDEKVYVVGLNEFGYASVPNLRWLIPMATLHTEQCPVVCFDESDAKPVN